MPDRIREALTKEIRNFIWGENVNIPRLGLNQLENTKDDGGIKLLNLKNRNKAIEIVWLKGYLDLTELRPTWAYISDILINETTPKNLNENTRVNAYLQNWKIPVKGKCADKLGKDTIRMIKAAKKHNATFAPINISKDLQEALPAWQHLGVEKTAPQNHQSKCLTKNHKSTRIRDMLKITECLQGQYSRGTHTPVYTCRCKDCTTDRERGCKNPQCCAIEAQKRINKITLKLNPMRPHNQDNLTLTKRRLENNEQTSEDDEEEEQGTTFNPSVMVNTNLSDCFRIFTDPSKTTNIPATRQHPRGITIPKEEITIYTDGSCFNNSKENARCGSGIWIEEGSNQNRALRIPGPDQ
ncbi:hypothetical protein EDB89DRAFT_1846301 [Lactarius sanguifluus]|nr:hypothetical protein EDB89DRAFT_1846301 [Lactarius sanguifluus]